MECDRLVRVDGLQLSNCLFAYGQAWTKLERGDKDGADAAMRQAQGIVPPETVDLITSMITRGELPVPGPDGKWTDKCRDAREGRLTLSLLVCSDQAAHERAVAADPAPRLRATPVPGPPPRQVESEADFLKRLSRIRAEAEAKHAAARITPSEADELRALGLL